MDSNARPERDPRVIEEFRRRRTKQLWVTIPAVLVIMALIWSMESRGGAPVGLPQSAALSIKIAVLFGLIIFSFGNWRCPACNAYLGKSLGPRFCQKCGAQLR